jgi:hypothetical protein
MESSERDQMLHRENLPILGIRDHVEQVPWGMMNKARNTEQLCHVIEYVYRLLIFHFWLLKWTHSQRLILKTNTEKETPYIYLRDFHEKYPKEKNEQEEST